MDLNILQDIVIIFALSTLVNYIFTRFKIPTIIGYLITGVVAGPYALAVIHVPKDIELMAEIGIILLLFTIGLEFSLNHLLKIRRIVFWGGLLQLVATTAVVMLIVHLMDLSWGTSLFAGLITALSSTAVVLKILQERSELSSNYGRTVLGILIFQDIVLVPLLLFVPLLAGSSESIGGDLLLLAVKTVFIVGLVFVGNRWIMPKLLHTVALTRNHELFFMSVLLICFSVALLTSSLGMSLAFGAFLGGLMISDSAYSHNTFGNIAPFKDTFTSFFFVSIGMLLNLSFVVEHFWLVVASVIVVVLVKMVIGMFCAFILGHTLKGTILVGLAISQVGEFSFILAQLGLDYTLISPFYFQLFLSTAIITMAISPFLIHLGESISGLILKLPIPKFLVEGIFPLQQIDIPELKDHLVLIGKDSRALNISVMAKRMNLPYISIIFDPAIVRAKQQKGETVIYGDAINIPILRKAHIDTARVVVISIGDPITAMTVTERVRQLNKHAVIIVRSRQIYDIQDIYRLGADHVIPEEFETSINLFERVLTKYLVPRKDILQTIESIREDNYGIFRDRERLPDTFMPEIPNIEVLALKIDHDCMIIGSSLAEVNFRKVFGVTIVAINRQDTIIDHPGPSEKLREGDIVYVLGTQEQAARAAEMIAVGL
ncbi:MAG: cation:proton antiporter [Cyclobacteriaceae bacterium]|nr:cation:proton antiporter [Cyclobacteriaceae bacterium]